MQQEAIDHILRSLKEGRLAHAYIVEGHPRMEGRSFSEAVAGILMCTDEMDEAATVECRRRIAEGLHPDLHWLEPESKSRQITIKEIRELSRRLYQTSFEGGWKVAVIRHADRMTEQGANAFLKTLEEPPQRTLILLVTASPQAMLTTIRSRCQLIRLREEEDLSDEEWCEPVLEVLRHAGQPAPFSATLFAAQLAGILKSIEGEIRDTVSDEAEEGAVKEVIEARVGARFREIRGQIMTFILNWHRDVLLAHLGIESSIFYHQAEVPAIQAQAQRLSYAQCRARIQSVEKLAYRLDRYLPAGTSLEVACASWG